MKPASESSFLHHIQFAGTIPLAGYKSAASISSDSFDVGDYASVEPIKMHRVTNNVSLNKLDCIFIFLLINNIIQFYLIYFLK